MVKDAQLVEGLGEPMDEQRKIAKQKLKDIPKLSTFNDILESSTLSDFEKEVVKLHYLKRVPLETIGDLKGYSRSAIMKVHKTILNKLSKIL